jgi:hypothetical protein
MTPSMGGWQRDGFPNTLRDSSLVLLSISYVDVFLSALSNMAWAAHHTFII